MKQSRTHWYEGTILIVNDTHLFILENKTLNNPLTIKYELKPTCKRYIVNTKQNSKLGLQMPKKYFHCSKYLSVSFK